MNQLLYCPRPRGAPDAARSSFLRFVADNNPCYLLSAACMLGGLMTLTNSLSFSPIPQQRLILLIATLNLYEGVIIALAAWLITQRGLMRDGSMLLGIEALFLADIAWLNSEIFTDDLHVGLGFNLALLIVAGVKLAAVYRMLRLRIDGRFALVLLILVTLYAMPGVFKQLSQGQRGAALPATVIYFAWWVIGALPVLAAVLWRGPSDLIALVSMSKHDRVRRRIIGMFIVVTFISILIHLSLSNWVYKVRWYNANLAPLMLGIAVAAGSYDRHVVNLCARMRTELLLPGLAILFSVNFPSALVIGSAQQMTPLRAVLLGATIVYLHGFVLHRHVWFAVAACNCFVSASLGSSVGAIFENLFSPVKVAADATEKVVPRTGTQWGMVSIVASFVLLALGAGISMALPKRLDKPRERFE